MRENSNKVRWLQYCAIALATFAAGQADASDLIDALGTKVHVVDHPVRVVTLAPSLGELAADLVGESLDRIVGVSDFTDFPPALSKVKSVGPYSRFNLETVAALKPDLVLATTDGNSRDQVDHLRELGLPVFVVKTSSFAEIEESIRLLSRVLDAEKAGAEISRRFKQGLANVAARTEARKKAGVATPRVLLQLDHDPLIVVGKAAFLNEALAKVGAINVYSDVDKPYPKPSLEDAVKRDPDVILVLGMGKKMSTFEVMGKDWRRFPKMKVVRDEKIRILAADTIIRPSLRVLEGLSLLEKAIYEK